MNCPSRTDDNILRHPTWNQSPPPLTPDLTTRQDFNGLVNTREQRDHTAKGPESFVECNTVVLSEQQPGPGSVTGKEGGEAAVGSPGALRSPLHFLQNVSKAVAKYFKFIGPGFMIAVAYIDPGNYATDVSAGAETKFALLFIVFASNLIAVLLQSLCIKLGSVTGLDLAQNCRAHLPRWLVIIIYVFAEAAILATDISEVRLVLTYFAFPAPKSKSVQMLLQR
jgi:metal iron transporter